LAKEEMRRLPPHKSKKMERMPRMIALESFMYSNTLLPTRTPTKEKITTDTYKDQSLASKKFSPLKANVLTR
jgi:hypothetical protein